MTPEQEQARKNQWSDIISRVADGINEWDANTQKARQILMSPQLRELMANITDEDFSSMGTHAKYDVQKLTDAYYASIAQAVFLNMTLAQAVQLQLIVVPEGVELSLDIQLGDALRWMKP